MGLILDTNALSAFVDGDKSLLPVLQSSSELSIPVIVLGEYLFGIRQSKLRKFYDQWLNSNLKYFEILTVDVKTTNYYAEIRQELKSAGCPISTNDLWIAAMVREHKQPLVTKDSHFDAVTGLTTVHW